MINCQRLTQERSMLMKSDLNNSGSEPVNTMLGRISKHFFETLEVIHLSKF